MSHVVISVGNRQFEVACNAGEEQFVTSAGARLDAEAQAFAAQLGRMPEARMLLMAGLMLADRTGALEDELVSLRHQVGTLEARLAAPARVEKVEVERIVEVQVPVEVQVEVPVPVEVPVEVQVEVIPEDMIAAYEALVDRVEAIVREAEGRIAAQQA
ncbi:ZapA family cell division protein [Ketogulonicigenium robustum]|uniref:ZapA family cell division protein n=1 Tax=Ketogulonicigenium robustum TaxID=92947 RepID=A0A1W6P0M3_9RHOB|nr:cell division protein ZapA [Ketogulonicigenium robustum]ARO15066.1 ZapA family cell division protein [Ketogulonicigenium robustum]